MKYELKEAFKKAAKAHNTGDLKLAHRIYLSILQKEPQHPFANYGMGRLAAKLEEHGKALSFFKTAATEKQAIKLFWIS